MTMVLPAFSRRVRRLHLRAENEDDAAHAATLLADALHTASLPGADQSRLVVVRRLALGPISPHGSPASLALRIEQVAREAVAEAVSYDAPAARDANAVVFPDRGEAIVELARRHARREPVDQWFWTRIVPGWATVGASRTERWRLTVDTAYAVPAAAVVAAAVVHEAARAGAADELLSSIASGCGTRWLRATGWGDLDPRRVDSSRPPTGEVRHAAIVARWVRAWGWTDDRLIWFTTLLAVHENAASIADEHLPARAARMLRDVHGERTSHGPEPQAYVDSPRGAAPSEKPAMADTGWSAARPAVQRDASDRTPFAPPRLAAPSTAAPDARLARAADVETSTSDRSPEPGASAPSPRSVSGCFTPYAGLFLVVSVLTRLRFAAFLTARPRLIDRAFPLRLLWFIGCRFGLNADDPLATALRTAGAIDDCWLHRTDEALDAACVAWFAAVRRWCRRHRGVALRALICRPGRVEISRTHIDVTFTLSQIDPHIRGLALDVDPGWVRWLGRVVHFHYFERDDAIG